MEPTETSPFPIEIGRVNKTKKEIYIVSVNEYSGKVYLDIRLHVIVDPDSGETIPTKKGITLNMRTFEPIAKLMLEGYKILSEIQKKEDVVSEEP